MITVTPEGSVYICKTPLEKDYKHQLTFTNVTSQTSYFASKVVKSYADFTYVKKDGYITVNENIDVIRDANYLFYKNTGFSNRIFYCFITKMEYMNENATRIYFKTDVFQTYYFNIEYKQCFVEREHVADDTIGKHTVPEGLDCGEYVINDMRRIPLYETATPSADWYICFVASKLPYNTAAWFQNPQYNIGGVYSPLYMFAVSDYTAANNIIKVYEEHGETTSEAIINMYMVPAGCVEASYVVWTSTSVNSVQIHQLQQQGYTSGELTLELPTVLPGSYTPKNAKLYTYPYSYIYIDNNSGISAEYRWEDFPNTTTQSWAVNHPVVSYYKAIIPSASLSTKLFFKTYKGNSSTGAGDRCYNYGLSFGKVPVCAWINDYYTNWLTQNGVNVGGGILSSAIKGAAGGAVGGFAGMAAGAAIGALTSTIGALGEMHKAETTPDQAKGDTNTGDFTFAYAKNAMNFYMMSIRPEYSVIIDNFFTMYGYKVNTVKTPSITGRAYWNYVKTIDCNVEGDIPQDDLMEIRDIFNNGCTFWHDPTKMFDYSLTNSIIS